MKYLIILLSSALLLSACGDTPKPQNPESTLNFGGIEIKTRKFGAFIIDGKAKISFSDYLSNGEELTFSLRFNLAMFPNHDSFQVSYGGANLNQCNIGFIWQRTQYLVDRHNTTYLQASTHSNGKGKYILPQTWFYSQIPDTNSNGFIRGNDSILVSGTFYEANEVTIR